MEETPAINDVLKMICNIKGHDLLPDVDSLHECRRCNTYIECKPGSCGILPEEYREYKVYKGDRQ